MKKTTIGLLALWVATVILGILGLGKHSELRRSHTETLAQLQEKALSRPALAQPAIVLEKALSQEEKLELMRLRNEVTQLRASSKAANDAREALEKAAMDRRQTTEPATAAVAKEANPGLPREEWGFRGYGTPEDGLISSFWAAREGDVNAALEAMTPEERARWEKQNEGKTENQKKAALQRQVRSVTGVRFTGQEQISPTEVVVDLVMDREETSSNRMRMKLVGNEWKAEAETSYDPLAFYRKNPELMKRYFPHLYQQQGQTQAQAQE